MSFQVLPWILENLLIGFLKAPIFQIKIVKSVETKRFVLSLVSGLSSVVAHMMATGSLHGR